MPTLPSMLDLSSVYRGKRVLVTGHTGFKGGWLALWLSKLGAEVTGISLPAEGDDTLFETARIGDVVDHRIGDIRSQEDFSRAVGDLDAHIVFHLAAQPIVRASYRDPVNTYASNVVGTAVVLEAARRMPSLEAAVVITSDKCYENNEWDYGYRETDAMGGADPYSASKACTELLVNSYRRSFFSGEDAPLLASARAGNVFGGGDWAEDRLFPDIVRGAKSGEPVVIRNRASIRPWQHVLEPLHGYLILGAQLLEGDASMAEGWNFGPDTNSIVTVETLANEITSAWGAGGPRFTVQHDPSGPARSRHPSARQLEGGLAARLVSAPLAHPGGDDERQLVPGPCGRQQRHAAIHDAPDRRFRRTRSAAACRLTTIKPRVRENNEMRVNYGQSVHGQEEIDAVIECLQTSTQMGRRVREMQERVAASSQRITASWSIPVRRPTTSPSRSRTCRRAARSSPRR